MIMTIYNYGNAHSDSKTNLADCYQSHTLIANFSSGSFRTEPQKLDNFLDFLTKLSK